MKPIDLNIEKFYALNCFLSPSQSLHAAVSDVQMEPQSTDVGEVHMDESIPLREELILDGNIAIETIEEESVFGELLVTGNIQEELNERETVGNKKNI